MIFSYLDRILFSWFQPWLLSPLLGKTKKHFRFLMTFLVNLFQEKNNSRREVFIFSVFINKKSNKSEGTETCICKPLCYWLVCKIILTLYHSHQLVKSHLSRWLWYILLKMAAMPDINQKIILKRKFLPPYWIFLEPVGWQETRFFGG